MAQDVGEQVLSYFWDLASLEQATHVSAAISLANAVEESQKDVPAKASTATLNESLAQCSKLSSYVLQRLCRGLASSREGARQGFSVGLALVLQKLPFLPPSHAAELLEAKLEKPRGQKGEQVRDYLLALLFGAGAIARSRGDAPGSLSAGEARPLAALILSTGQKKTFLRDLSATLLAEVAGRVAESERAELVEALPELVTALSTPLASATPDDLLLALLLWPVLPRAAFSNCALLPQGPAPPVAALCLASGRALEREAALEQVESAPADGHAPPPQQLSARQLKDLCAAQTAFFSSQHLDALRCVLCQTINTKGRLHGLWPVVLAFLLPSALPRAPQTLQQLWQGVLEPEFVASSRLEKRHLGASLSLLLLPRLAPADFPTALPRALVQPAAAHLVRPQSLLQPVAARLLERCSALYARSSPPVRLALLNALRMGGGGPLADRLLADDRRRAARAGAGPEAPDASARREQDAALLVHLQEILAEAGSPAAATRALDNVTALLRQPRVDEGVFRDGARFCALLGFCELAPGRAGGGKGGADPALAAAFRCASVAGYASFRLAAAGRLIALVDARSRAQGGPRGADGAQERADFVAEIVEWLVKLSGPKKFGVELLHANGALEGPRQALMRTKAPATRALAHLWHVLQLMTWTGQAEVEGAVLETLGVALVEAGRELEGGAEPASAEVEGHWSERLLTSCLQVMDSAWAPLPMQPLRSSTEAVVRVCAERLTARALGDVLRAATASLHVQVEGEEDEEMEAGSGGEDDEEGGEEAEGEDVKDEDEEESDASDCSDSDYSSSDSFEEEEEQDASPASPPKKPRTEHDPLLRAALPTLEGGGASGSDSDSEASMDDEAMFRLDAQIGAVVAEGMRRRSAAKKRTREARVHSRQRALGLLDAYCRRLPDSPHASLLAGPLLRTLVQLARAGAEETLFQRTEALITERLARGKANARAASRLEAGPFAQELETELRLGSKPSDPRVERAAQQVYIHLQRLAHAAPAEAGGKASKKGAQLSLARAAQESAAKAAEGYLDRKRQRLNRAFFATLLQRVPELKPVLLPVFEVGAREGKGNFLRKESAALLNVCQGGGAKMGGKGKAE